MKPANDDKPNEGYAVSEPPNAVKPDNGEAERVMAAAWPEFGGNHQPAEFWETFSLAVQFTLKQLSSHDETAK